MSSQKPLIRHFKSAKVHNQITCNISNENDKVVIERVKGTVRYIQV